MAIQQSPLRELALFAGAGGGILGGHILGWRTVCAVERDAYAAGVLAQRQNDGCLAPFPIWSDVTTFDGKPWRGLVDVISGGFPCQDISAAGRGEGISGARSGLWSEFARIIGEVRPRFVFVENSPVLTSRGLGLVLGDLASMGYDAEWGVLGAADVGAPHQRDRIWIVADTGSGRFGKPEGGQVEQSRGAETFWAGGEPASLADPDSLRQLQSEGCEQDERGWIGDSSEQFPDSIGQRAQVQEEREFSAEQNPWRNGGENWKWPTEPSVGRVVNGLAYRVDRLKAIGNGQVPRVAASAFIEAVRLAKLYTNPPIQ